MHSVWNGTVRLRAFKRGGSYDLEHNSSPAILKVVCASER